MTDELLVPRRFPEKLRYAYSYGADAAYIGIGGFLAPRQSGVPGRKPYCALNISFCRRDLARLREHIALFEQCSLDAFTIQDLGLLDLLDERFPHTNTQTNCINREVHRQTRFFLRREKK